MIRNYVRKFEGIHSFEDIDDEDVEIEVRQPSKDVLDKLFDAIKNNDLNAVKRYINLDYDINAKDEYGNTPLICTSLLTGKKALEIFKLLLNSGANINVIADNTKNTALIGVCGNQWVTTDIIETLIKLGADINAKNIGGYTPLLKACENNNEDIVELLLKHGANPNIISIAGDTPLCFACMNRNKEIIKMLLEHNADLNFKLKNNRTFIEDALLRYGLDIIRLLINNSKSKINYTEILKIIDERRIGSSYEKYEIMNDLIEAGATPTMKILSDIICNDIFDNENLEFVKEIIKRNKLDVDECVDDIYNETILTKLIDQCMSEDITDELNEFILFLLNKGADINHRGGDGHSPLRMAVNNNNEELVEFLLKNGADANTRDSYNKTPLMSTDNLDICQLLLDYGADINAQDTSGDTALHYATCSYSNPYGNYKMVKFLLDHGADTDIKNKRGELPSDRIRDLDIEKLYFGDDDYDEDEDYYDDDEE